MVSVENNSLILHDLIDTMPDNWYPWHKKQIINRFENIPDSWISSLAFVMFGYLFTNHDGSVIIERILTTYNLETFDSKIIDHIYHFHRLQIGARGGIYTPEFHNQRIDSIVENNFL